MGCQNSVEADNPLKIKYHFSAQLLFPINKPQNLSKKSVQFRKLNKAVLASAISYYQNFIEKQPHFEHPFDGLGCPEQLVGCLEGKVEEWYKSQRQKGTVLGNPYDALSLCFCLSEQKQSGESWYLEMIEKQPEIFQLYFGLGNIYYGMGQFEKSQQFYRKALELNPRLEKAYQNIAFIYCYHLYDNSQASEWSTFALKLNPDNPYASLIREWVREDVVKRVQNLVKLVRRHPNYARIYNALGTTHIQLQEYSQAIKWFQKGIKINPIYHPLHYGLALTYNKVGMADEAIKLSQKTLESNPSHHQPYSSIGEAYTVKGNFSEAEQWYKKCLEVNPHFYPAYCELAKMYIRQERNNQAIKLLEQTIEINPDLTEALFMLGKIKIQSGQKGEGLSLIQQVLELQYDNELVLKFMEVYWKLDKPIRTQDDVEEMKLRIRSELEGCYGLGDIGQAESQYQAQEK